ncbi:hypothetical protein MBM_07995 [Drepanopeziza brunnea f. sp. 'multigermtubi' MB_m1]|uniref:Uncharacterized protein n=1 Tax=Marssonina brunnea f. sp. multigermtubi (strain MB_m1) TaxID=1072389 RepID=K1XMU7_MARBU|nr:uncharacterized protein MBM_07995 [Drepanopeziza brunnea f. sp. 'multigermtubi' MB_m1]EKD13794.1 hypothetical protein MBM_07995 [Drepanopeziza brunnea f. sp. 'multigermtubi' MB_m1]
MTARQAGRFVPLPVLETEVEEFPQMRLLVPGRSDASGTFDVGASFHQPAGRSSARMLTGTHGERGGQRFLSSAAELPGAEVVGRQHGERDGESVGLAAAISRADDDTDVVASHAAIMGVICAGCPAADGGQGSGEHGIAGCDANDAAPVALFAAVAAREYEEEEEASLRAAPGAVWTSLPLDAVGGRADNLWRLLIEEEGVCVVADRMGERRGLWNVSDLRDRVYRKSSLLSGCLLFRSVVVVNEIEILLGTETTTSLYFSLSLSHHALSREQPAQHTCLFSLLRSLADFHFGPVARIGSSHWTKTLPTLRFRDGQRDRAESSRFAASVNTRDARRALQTSAAPRSVQPSALGHPAEWRRRERRVHRCLGAPGRRVIRKVQQQKGPPAEAGSFIPDRHWPVKRPRINPQSDIQYQASTAGQETLSRPPPPSDRSPTRAENTAARPPTLRILGQQEAKAGRQDKASIYHPSQNHRSPESGTLRQKHAMERFPWARCLLSGAEPVQDRPGLGKGRGRGREAYPEYATTQAQEQKVQGCELIAHDTQFQLPQ